MPFATLARYLLKTTLMILHLTTLVCDPTKLTSIALMTRLFTTAAVLLVAALTLSSLLFLRTSGQGDSPPFMT